MSQPSSSVTREFEASELDGHIAQAMLASSPECVKLLEPTGELRFMSPNGQQLMEIDDFGKVSGAYWWDLWPEDARQLLRDAVAAAGRGVAVTFEADCPTAGGVWKHWEVRVSRISGGSYDGMILAESRDITAIEERRRIEIQLARENEVLRRFSHLIAHDLRNPIRQLKVLSELAYRQLDAATNDKEVLERISQSAGTLIDLLDGLERLCLSEKDLGEREHVRIPEIVADARAQLDDTAVNVLLDMQDDSISVFADRHLLTVAFCQMLENSRKFHDGSSPCEVRISGKRKGDREVEIVLQDNGPGFVADRLDEVFKPLVRQSNSLGKPGSGVGLALVARIVEKHGGTVGVVPHQAGSHGAGIRIELPVMVSAA